LSSNSFGRGEAGDIEVNAAEAIEMKGSVIEANTEITEGGSISIISPSVMLLNNSDIQTYVSQGNGEGGNIRITGEMILAFDDSDILAFSNDGSGGNVDLNTLGFFGEGFFNTERDYASHHLNGNEKVDVSASGRISSGEIHLPDVSFVENNIAELADNLINSGVLVDGSCIDSDSDVAGTFTLSGDDRFPQTPDNSSTSAYATGTVSSIPIADVTTDYSLIEEPQRVSQLSDGRLVMSRPCH